MPDRMGHIKGMRGVSLSAVTGSPRIDDLRLPNGIRHHGIKGIRTGKRSLAERKKTRGHTQKPGS